MNTKYTRNKGIQLNLFYDTIGLKKYEINKQETIVKAKIDAILRFMAENREHKFHAGKIFSLSGIRGITVSNIQKVLTDLSKEGKILFVDKTNEGTEGIKVSNYKYNSEYKLHE